MIPDISANRAGRWWRHCRSTSLFRSFNVIAPSRHRQRLR